VRIVSNSEVPVQRSGVEVIEALGPRYAGEPDGHAYATTEGGIKRYRITMRPTGSPIVVVI